MSTKILAITGPTCSGKTTLAKELEKTGVFRPLMGFTTRAPRKEEVPDIDYKFLSVDEAKNTIESGEAVEHVYFNGNYYGILKSEVEYSKSLGKASTVILEPGGLTQFKNLYKDQVISVFLDTPMQEMLERFLRRFAVDSPSDIQYYAKRLQGLFVEASTWRNTVKWDFCFSCTEFSLPKIVDFLVKVI